jgi:radical S-adenosyl methionine domain-containing protein 2
MGEDGIAAPAASGVATAGEPWTAGHFDAAGVGAASGGWSTSALPPSVNYHLWAFCNMRCRFCFAPFQDVVSTLLPEGHLSREDSLRLVRILAARFDKVSFAGGEPTLCPWLPELAHASREAGATTMLVTNGSRLPQCMDRLKGAIDWVTLSIDSASEQTLVTLGRAVQGKTALSPERYLQLAGAVRRAGMRLKVNTVVTSANAREDLAPLMRALRPERWKLLRVLPVAGQNSGRVEPLLSSDDDFAGFVERHRGLSAEGIEVVPEDNDDMRGSYAMVDPAGRFFDNAGGGHRYTAPILSAGVDAAWAQATFSMPRFVGRGGHYDWGGRR